MFIRKSGLVTSQGSRMAEMWHFPGFLSGTPAALSPRGVTQRRCREVAALPALHSPTQGLVSGGHSELGTDGAGLGRTLPASGRFWNKSWSMKHTVHLLWEALGVLSFLLNET